MSGIDYTPSAASDEVAIAADSLDVGTEVEVRCRFDRSWARGFVVTRRDDDGYRLSRTGDGDELPVAFDIDDLRAIDTPPDLTTSRLVWPALQPRRST